MKKIVFTLVTFGLISLASCSKETLDAVSIRWPYPTDFPSRLAGITNGGNGTNSLTTYPKFWAIQPWMARDTTAIAMAKTVNQVWSSDGYPWVEGLGYMMYEYNTQPPIPLGEKIYEGIKNLKATSSEFFIFEQPDSTLYFIRVPQSRVDSLLKHVIP